jgi:Spy/CpxP family protein refolding chaperone
MKTLPALAFAASLALEATTAAAQAPAAGAAPSSAELRARVQADKKGVVQKNLPLTEAEAAKFWPVYEKIQKDIAGPQSQVNRAIVDYVANEATMNEAQVKKLVKEVLDAQSREMKLREKHWAEVQKVLPAKKAARYMQIENKIRALLAYEAAAAIPLIP